MLFDLDIFILHVCCGFKGQCIGISMWLRVYEVLLLYMLFGRSVVLDGFIV